MVEIGGIDIATECSLLSSHLEYPPEGHFGARKAARGALDTLHAEVAMTYG